MFLIPIWTVSSLQTLPVLWTCHLSYTPQESCQELFAAQWMPTPQLRQSDGRKMATPSESRRSVMHGLLTSEMSRLFDNTPVLWFCSSVLLTVSWMEPDGRRKHSGGRGHWRLPWHLHLCALQCPRYHGTIPSGHSGAKGESVHLN